MIFLEISRDGKVLESCRKSSNKHLPLKTSPRKSTRVCEWSTLLNASVQINASPPMGEICQRLIGKIS